MSEPADYYVSPTHEVTIAQEYKKPIIVSVLAVNNIDAFTQAMREVFGTNREAVMPPMLLSIKRI